jgi:hypothetical protein
MHSLFSILFRIDEALRSNSTEGDDSFFASQNTHKTVRTILNTLLYFHGIYLHPLHYITLRYEPLLHSSINHAQVLHRL